MRNIGWLGVLLLALATWPGHGGTPQDVPLKERAPGELWTPQESRKCFHLPPGLTIELVACEPQVQSPVAMAFDPQGRIWVVEMADYPNGPEKGKPPLGRIRILEDRNGDGFYETATTWADNLLFANGLLLWKDGAIVTAAPHVVHLRDTDGDGKADRSDVMYEGFAAQNPQLRVSHPQLGPDGWITVANGLRGGKVVPVSKRAVEPKPVDLSGMDFRFDPLTGAHEAVTGPGQFGNTFDAWGARFLCDNRHHLRHVVMESRYIKRNPFLAAPPLVHDLSILEDGPLSSGGRIHPVSRNWTTSSLHEGRFTAACGVMIYQGGQLGARYQGGAFTCDPTGNLVHMETLTPKGATFEGKPYMDRVEFLASTDDFFRPVSLSHGPDGALYIVDMYRAVIEHPEFMPPELKNRPDLAVGRDKGRIWRVVTDRRNIEAVKPRVEPAKLDALVALLGDDDPWHRQAAQRLLLEKNDPALVEPLTKQFDTTKNPHAKIASAHLLNRQMKLSDPQVERMLDDAHPRVREHAVRLAEPRMQSSKALRDAVQKRIDDSDGRVVYQTALSLGGLDDEATPRRLAEIAIKHREDPWVRLAVLTAPPKQAAPVLQRFLDNVELESAQGRQAGAAAMVRELAAQVGAQKDASAYLATAKRLNSDLLHAVRFDGFAGLAEGLQRRGATLLSVAAELPEAERGAYTKSIDALMSEVSAQSRDAKQSAGHRLMCVRLLGQAPWPTAKAALLPLIADETAIELRVASLRAFASQSDREVPAALMKLWSSATPPLRREIMEAMLRQPDRVATLFDEIEAKRVKASDLDATRTRQLLQHPRADLRVRAKKLLADQLPGDRLAALKEYQPALTMKSDGKTGREIFKKHCATCHRVGGVGVDVGPDIADSRTKTLDALLTDIVQPNRAIDNNYVNYLVTTKEGRILSGVLANETATSVTLKRAGGESDIVLRREIEEIASTGLSLMPDGMEKTINLQEMADLLNFLKNWRYLDGMVPVGGK